MPPKTREQYQQDMKDSLGIKTRESYNEYDIKEFDELDKLYGENSVEELEKLLRDFETELSTKRPEVEKRKEELKDELNKKLEQDIARHQEKLDELAPIYNENIKPLMAQSDENCKKIDEARKIQLEMKNKNYENEVTFKRKCDVAKIEISNGKSFFEVFGLDETGHCNKEITVYYNEKGEKVPEEEAKINPEKYTAKKETVYVDGEKSIKERYNYVKADLDEDKYKEANTEIDKKLKKFENEKLTYEKEIKIINELKRSGPGSIRDIEGERFDYEYENYDKKYKDDIHHVRQVEDKKIKLGRYLPMRKALARKLEDIDKEKFNDSFKKYYDSKKDFENLGFFQRTFAHVFSGNWYKPAAMLRERDAYLDALKDLGFKQETIDAKVNELDNPVEQQQPEVDDNANRMPIEGQEAEKFENDISEEQKEKDTNPVIEGNNQLIEEKVAE